MRCSRVRSKNYLRSDDGTYFDEPTGEVPLVSTTDSRVTVTGADLAADLAEAEPVVDDVTLLPHWTDAPTGQVPIVVAREAAESDDPWSMIPTPAWREGEADWAAHEDQFDASFLASETRQDDVRPWEFTLPEDDALEEEVLVESPRPQPSRVQRTRRTVTHDPLAGRAVRPGNQRSVSMATLTGVVLALGVSLIFLAGTLPVTILVLCAIALATGEAYAALRSVGAHPATVLGLVAVLTLGVDAYNKGTAAIGAVTVLLVIFGFVWYVSAEKKIDVLDGIGATMFVYVWVGVLGSYALLMISPLYSSGGHGLAFLFGAIVLTIANDSGALFVGRWLGRRPLNRSLSPNKTVEGSIGGSIFTLVAGGVVLPMISPWTTSAGLETAVAVAIMVPLGDLFESMFKRTLGLKDLGRVLPGHGGLLDRIDGLLFALPTVFYLTHLLKLG